MALSILNNIPSLAAQNQLSITGAGLQKTLYRLSSGSRINSGADDAAGLAIADGLRANVSALTQSARNATDGVGKLQVADGALAQVTNLLNRAVTLATEAGTGTVSDTQRKALNTEFTSIKAEVVRIGQKTSFNGDSIFNSAAAPTDKNTLVASAHAATSATALTTAKDTGDSFTFTTDGTLTSQDLVDQINSSTTINATASFDNNGNLQILDKNGNGSLSVVSDLTDTGAIAGAQQSGSAVTDIFLSDGTSAGAGSISVNIGILSDSKIGFVPIVLTSLPTTY